MASLPGAKNPSWRGDDVGYIGAHIRLRKAKGPASAHDCVDCGEQAREWSFNNSTDVSFSTDFDDYEPRCKRCHVAYDRQAGAWEGTWPTAKVL